MYWTEFDTTKFLCCSVETPVSRIADVLLTSPAPLLLLGDTGRLEGIIHDGVGLIRDHAYFGSRFPIGQVLSNTLKVFLIATATEEMVAGIVRGKIDWIDLKNNSGKTIATVATTEALILWLQEWNDELIRVA